MNVPTQRIEGCRHCVPLVPVASAGVRNIAYGPLPVPDVACVVVRLDDCLSGHVDLDGRGVLFHPDVGENHGHALTCAPICVQVAHCLCPC